MAEWSHCPHCGSFNATGLHGTAHRKGLYQCNEPECREQFRVTVGTVFERSKIPLHKWVLAAHLMGASKKGMSSKQIERMLGVTYKTAWFMTMRLREAMRDKYATPDRRRGQDRRERRDLRRRQEEERPQGQARAQEARRACAGGARRRGAREARCRRDGQDPAQEPSSRRPAASRELHTDEALAYDYIGKEFAKHRTVNHSQDEYFRYEDGAGVQSAESFFAILKRGVYGTFHSISEQHLQRYCDEFAFRWNNRSALGIEDFERAAELLSGAKGKRLTYRRPDDSPRTQKQLARRLWWKRRKKTVR